MTTLDPDEVKLRAAFDTYAPRVLAYASRHVDAHAATTSSRRVPDLLGADGATFVEKLADLVEDQRVALDSRGVVRLLMPQVSPGLLGLGRTMKPTNARAQILDCLSEAVVDALT